jgi:esterase/lipase superfamily enzyme
MTKEKTSRGVRMKRVYEKWYSPSLGREMEMLVFGHGGVPVIVFPTSCGRFYEFEDQKMVEALSWKLGEGKLQLFCVDSVDGESWYNNGVPPRWKIARQMQYQDYVMNEVVPYIRNGGNRDPHLATCGCSFGAYHAANLALKHPDTITGFLSMGGAFDVSNFLHGYHDEDVYFNMPPQYLRNMSDPWYLERYRRNTYVLATGEWDICLGKNQQMAEVMRSRGIPVRLDVWGWHSKHDWPDWRLMVQEYL